MDETQRRIAVNLYRFWLWADMTRIRFEEVHARSAPEINRRLADRDLAFRRDLLEPEMQLCLWLSLLHVVVEGWPRLRAKDDTIKTLLRSPYKDLLQDFRNATFHPNDYDDARLEALRARGQASIDWARELTRAFGTFLGAALGLPGVVPGAA
jgi:hypothetical protein